MRRHFVQQIAETLDIGVVERRIDFVEHADRRGLIRNIAKISAIAVSACSPPDSSESACSRLPGGRAKISRPASSGSSDSVKVSLASPPPNSLANRVLEVLVHLHERGQQPLAAFAVQALNAAAQPFDGADQIVAVGGQRGEALFVLARFFLGAQIDAAQLLALLLEFFDALLGLFERRKFLAVLYFGAFGQIVRRDFQFVADAAAEFGDARLGAFQQSLFAGALLARHRQRVVRGLGDLVGFGQTGFRFGARIAGLRALGFGDADGVEQAAALLRDGLRQ